MNQCLSVEARIQAKGHIAHEEVAESIQPVNVLEL